MAHPSEGHAAPTQGRAEQADGLVPGTWGVAEAAPTCDSGLVQRVGSLEQGGQRENTQGLY